MRRLGLLLFLASAIGRAEDPRLSQIRAILEPLRGRSYDESGLRGATPAFTTVKHLLRDWIEARLAKLRQSDDPVALAGALNRELLDAGLLNRDFQDNDNVFLGYLGEIRIEHPGYLLVTTGVGVQMCGFDESAYLYDFPADHWRRIFESEQNDYTKDKYLPQDLRGVHVSPPNFADGADRSEMLVLSLGWHRWCTSNWQGVYFRVWRIKAPYSEPKMLLNEFELAYRAREPEIKGSVGFNDVLIEYAVSGRDHSREEVRHYQVGPDDRVTRVDPIALSPLDFVDEWRIRPWSTSAAWTQASVRQKLLPAHQRLNSKLLLQSYMPTTHCTDRPDLWQVSADASAYFLVRWMPPYRFTMVDVSDHRWKTCDELDPHADEFRTLFPDQDWR